MNTPIYIKRAYEAESASDGFRVYIDRLWPRGLSHETFHYDLWAKEISPSSQLREWFHADPTSNWYGFCERYAEELKSNPAFAFLKKQVEDKEKVTLLYSSHDKTHNNAIVVQALLKQS